MHSPLECRLFTRSLSPHLQQLYTGFKILDAEGFISLSQHVSQPKPFDNHAHLQVEIRNKNKQTTRLYFDCHDSEDIDEAHLNLCDFYFKRSYSRHYVSTCRSKYAHKIFPLGLYYLVLPNNPDLFSLKRHLILSKSFPEKLAGIVNSIYTNRNKNKHSRMSNLHSFPTYDLPLKVLFMATAYDPYDKPDRSKEKIEERVHNNEMRAKCIRILRKELGSQFYGGFVWNQYTTKHFKDLLIDTSTNGGRKNYLNLVKSSPICIATTGLHGSIGGKFAEYIAYSRAIVTEKLQYEVPGNLKKNHHYLEFSTPEECVEQSIKLITDHEFRRQMMKSNSEYYQNFVSPSRLVFNALSTALYEN